HMPLRTFVGSLLCLLFCLPTVGRSQDAPPRELLDSLLPQLRKKLPATEASFQVSPSEARPTRACGMRKVTMRMARGDESRSFSIFIDNNRRHPISPTQMLARITRLMVDADGAARAYHPDDPYGERACSKFSRPDGSIGLEGICALDEISNAGIRVFNSGRRAIKNRNQLSSANEPDLAQEWNAAWPLIKDKKLRSYSLKELAGPDSPDG